MKRFKPLVPWIVSLALLGLVIWQVSPERLAAAIAGLDWQRLVPLTAAMVLAMYLWDSACLRWLFSQDSVELSYLTALHARGLSYLACAVNYEVGQGMLGWVVARSQGTSVVAALSRCVLLALHDAATLFVLGLFGSIAALGQPRARGIMYFCIGGLVTLGLFALFVRFSPSRWRQKWKQTKWGGWIGWWRWHHSLQLWIMRSAYFAISLSYATAGLAVCGVTLEPSRIFSAIPIALFIDGLPISVSGLGTREQALTLLLKPDRPELVVAFSLFWTAGQATGRIAIGLCHLWLPRLYAWVKAR